MNWTFSGIISFQVGHYFILRIKLFIEFHLTAHKVECKLRETNERERGCWRLEKQCRDQGPRNEVDINHLFATR